MRYDVEMFDVYVTSLIIPHITENMQQEAQLVADKPFDVVSLRQRIQLSTTD